MILLQFSQIPNLIAASCGVFAPHGISQVQERKYSRTFFIARRNKKNFERVKRMIRIALVEDDLNYRKKLVSYLEQYEKESCGKIYIAVFTDGDEIVEEYKADYDIILMDIEMKFMDGMTAAEKIREVDSEVVIIFITNMPQFVMKGYMVDALDYVLKPITYFSFSQKIDRAITRMKKRNEKYITIAIKGGMQKLNVAKILYIEVQDHSLIFHTVNGEYTTKGTMRDVEELLRKENFFRCNKCYLINLGYVENIQNYDVKVKSDVVQVSRSRKKGLIDALNNYLNEGSI